MKRIKHLLFSLFLFLPQLGQGDLPNVVVETPIGEQLDLWEFKGKPVIMTLWASWCEPCRKKLPSLAKLQAQYPNIPILAISIDRKNLPPILREIRAQGIELKHVYHDRSNTLLDHLKITGIPCTIVFDAQGREISRITHVDSIIENDPEVRKVLKGK